MKNICERLLSKCVHETEKKQKLLIRNFNFILKSKWKCLFLFYERKKWKCLFLFHDWFPLEFVLRYNISVTWWEINSKQQNLFELIKRRSKVQEKNMSCERDLNFDQWKTFSENYKPMRVWLWVVHRFAENYCHLRLFSEFIQTQKSYPTSHDKTYSNLKTICHVKLTFFLWSKLLENVLLEKYLKSVVAPLINWNIKKT